MRVYSKGSPDSKPEETLSLIAPLNSAAFSRDLSFVSLFARSHIKEMKHPNLEVDQRQPIISSNTSGCVMDAIQFENKLETLSPNYSAYVDIESALDLYR